MKFWAVKKDNVLVIAHKVADEKDIKKAEIEMHKAIIAGIKMAWGDRKE